MQIQFLCQDQACDQKYPKNTVASHHLSQACISPRTTQEKLEHELWLTTCRQKFPRPIYLMSLYQIKFNLSFIIQIFVIISPT